MLEHETFYEYLRIIIKLIWEALQSCITRYLGQAGSIVDNKSQTEHKRTDLRH